MGLNRQRRVRYILNLAGAEGALKDRSYPVPPHLLEEVPYAPEVNPPLPPCGAPARPAGQSICCFAAQSVG